MKPGIRPGPEHLGAIVLAISILVNALLGVVAILDMVDLFVKFLYM